MSSRMLEQLDNMLPRHSGEHRPNSVAQRAKALTKGSAICEICRATAAISLNL